MCIYGGTRVAVTQVSIELAALFACHFGLSHSTFPEQGEMLCDSQLQVHLSLLSLKGLAAGHSWRNSSLLQPGAGISPIAAKVVFLSPSFNNVETGPSSNKILHV